MDAPSGLSSLAFWMNVTAILLSPLLAVQATVWIQRWREDRERKLVLFKTLMRTRAASLAPDHVQALNMIDIEFYGKDRRSKEVIRRWKAYHDHLNSGPTPPTEAWGSKKTELFIDLLQAMAICLRYDFDKTDIKNTSYFPQGHVDIEMELLRIRKGLADLLDGKRVLPIAVQGAEEEKDED